MKRERKRRREVLDDLDSFLDRLSEGEDEEGEEEEERSRIYSGDACHECRVCKNPAMTALLGGHMGCLKEILRANDIEKLAAIRSENGSTLAHIAARKRDVEALNLVVDNVTSLVTVGDIRGATPLHVCAYHGQEDGLLSLLDAGAEANQRDLDGATAVHFAAASGHLESLKLLVQRGRGNVNARSNSGETPVYFAAQEGHLACIHWLVEHARADPQLASTDGMTPLHAAAQTGRLNVTHWLVRSANCPITCRTSDGATPVHFAAAKGHVAILEWLLHHSLATGLEKDDFGATPVHDAAEQGQLQCLHVFYNHNIDLNQKDYDGFIPKDLAEERGHRECVQFLTNPMKAYMEDRKLHNVR
jgi:ankyrin repeat protein